MPEQGKERGLLSRKDQKTSLKKGKSYLLGIGIDQYEAFPNLNNAVKDVQDFKAVLEERYELDEPILLFNEQATRQGIIRELDKLERKAKPEDKVIIYYSGHGHLDHKKRGYWIPYDAQEDYTDQYVRNGTIKDYLQDIVAQHILLLSDACFSGALFDFTRSNQKFYEGFEKYPSRWGICSGRHDQKVYDGLPGKNSPFAESILTVLRSNENAQVNVAEFADKVVKMVNLVDYDQEPIGRPIKDVGDKGGQYIFRLKAGVAEAWAACEKEGTLSAYQTFLQKYPDSDHAEEAKAQIQFWEEETAWEKARRLNTVIAYYNYDKQYPKGRYNSQAWEYIKELEEEQLWKEASRKNTLFAYRQYLQTYPDGKHQNEADSRIEQLITATAERTIPIPAQKESSFKGPKSKPTKTPLKQQSTARTFVKKEPKEVNTPSKSWLWIAGAVLLIWGISTVMNTGADPDAGAEEALEEPVTLAEEVDTKSKVEKPTASSSNSQVASKIMKDGRRWTTKNLNVNVRGSYCYDDKDSNCSKYGRLYTWEAAKTACKRLGSGWRLPSDKEWEKLAIAYGGLIRQNGGKYEDIDNPKASYKSLLRGGDSGFVALLGGYRDSYGSYYLEGVGGKLLE